MDGFQKHYIEWKKPEERPHTLWFHLYKIQIQAKTSLSQQKSKYPHSQCTMEVSTRELSGLWKCFTSSLEGQLHTKLICQNSVNIHWSVHFTECEFYLNKNVLMKVIEYYIFKSAKKIWSKNINSAWWY